MNDIKSPGSFAGDDDLKEIYKSKNSLLSTIWRKGIPMWLKKTVWPITIGNKLEVKNILFIFKSFLDHTKFI